MAISSGVGPHSASANVNGQSWPIEHGSVTLNATRRSSSFSGVIPLSYPGAQTAFAELVGENETQISVTTRGATSVLITGEIDDVEFDYIGRTIRFTGRDHSARLQEEISSEKFSNQKTTDIVRTAIGRVGLSGNITESAVMAGKNLQQDYVKLTQLHSLGELIDELAMLDGARWFFDAKGIFHYIPLGAPAGIYSVNISQDGQPIRSDCLELHITHNLQAGKTISTTVRSWHPKKRQVFSHTSNIEGRGGSKAYRYNVPTLLQDHVEKHARSQGAEKARHEFTVTATVVGDPSVTAGMGLQVNGTPYDQIFEIDHVAHDFGMSGYRTHITARSAKAGRVPT